MPDQIQALIAALADEFATGRAELVRRLVEAVHADPDVPGDEELRRGTREAGEAVVDQLLAGLSGGADMSSVELPDAATRYAYEYAHRGIELSVLLAVIRIGYAEFSSQWSRRLIAVSPASAASLQALSDSLLEIFAYVDAVSTAFAVAYSGERERWSRSIDALRLDVVRAILAGEAVEELRASQQLGHRLDLRQRAFLVWSDAEPGLGLRTALESAAAQITARAAAGAALLVPLSSQMLAGWLAGAAADAPGIERDHLLRTGAFAVHAALGSPGDGIEGFRVSHRQALHARRVAPTGQAGAGLITDYTTVALPALASADPEHAAEFVASELRGLGAVDAATQRIADTVRVYLSEGSSRARTARRLGLHINTVAYRLARAAELLGHPLDERTAEVQVALTLTPLLVEQAGQPPRGSWSRATR